MAKSDEDMKNFPKEMGVPDDEQWQDYSLFRRNPKDTDVMRNIWRIFSLRLFPVLSMSYIAAVMGISLTNGTHFLFDHTAHFMGLMIICWVSIAPIVYICMKAMMGTYKDYAMHWYICIAALQAVCGLIFFFMFPDNLGPWLWGLHDFFVSSIPIHIVIYIFFIRRALPASAAWPLTIIGLVFMGIGLLLPI